MPVESPASSRHFSLFGVASLNACPSYGFFPLHLSFCLVAFGWQLQKSYAIVSSLLRQGLRRPTLSSGLTLSPVQMCRIHCSLNLAPLFARQQLFVAASSRRVSVADTLYSPFYVTWRHAGALASSELRYYLYEYTPFPALVSSATKRPGRPALSSFCFGHRCWFWGKLYISA